MADTGRYQNWQYQTTFGGLLRLNTNASRGHTFKPCSPVGMETRRAIPSLARSEHGCEKGTLGVSHTEEGDTLLQEATVECVSDPRKRCVWERYSLFICLSTPGSASRGESRRPPAGGKHQRRRRRRKVPVRRKRWRWRKEKRAGTQISRGH